MDLPRNDIILQKMLRYTEKLACYCEGYTYDRFAQDTKLVEACVFNLSQLGELCRVTDDAFAQQPVRKVVKIGRNDPCPCGSGLKWKKCTCAQYHPELK